MADKPRKMITYQLAWDHRRGPCSGPLVLAEAHVPHGPCPPEILALWRPGLGYNVRVITPLTAPPKRWSAERKAIARRKALQRRAERAAPLFAQEFVERELSRRPQYFAGEDVNT